MPYFSYKAKDRVGRDITGSLEASDEDELARKLKADGKYLIVASMKESRSRASNVRIKRRELMTFSDHLAAAFSAGVPILGALQGFGERTRNLTFKGIIQGIHDKVQGGSSLSDAFSEYPKIFPKVYVSVVKVGERAGNIEVLLSDLTKFMEWQEELERDVKKLITYPVLVITGIFAIIIALVTFVYPRIGGIFEKMGVQIPLATRWMLSLSNLIRYNLGIVITIVFALGVLFYLLKGSPRAALYIDFLKLRIPVIGEFLRKVAISRFVHHIAILQRAGIDISQSLQSAGEAVGNRFLMKKLLDLREKVIAGRPLSEACSEMGIFPDLVIRMIAIGELGGSIEDNLNKVCQHYDREVPAAVKRMLIAIEPITILFLASAVLFIAVSMYLPIYKLIGSIKYK